MIEYILHVVVSWTWYFTWRLLLVGRNGIRKWRGQI